MPIDIEAEDVFLLSEGQRKQAVGKSYTRLREYIVNGVPIADENGRRIMIKLESIKLPTGLATSVEAYGRFIRRLNGAAE